MIGRGLKLENALGGGTRPAVQKNKEMNERKELFGPRRSRRSQHPPLDVLKRKLDGGSLIHESTDSSLNITNIVIYDFVYLR